MHPVRTTGLGGAVDELNEMVGRERAAGYHSAGLTMLGCIDAVKPDVDGFALNEDAERVAIDHLGDRGHINPVSPPPIGGEGGQGKGNEEGGDKKRVHDG
jgi:hypothetical protein